MLFGSPYQRLIRQNGKALPAAQQGEEQRKFQQAVADRRSESAAARAKRVENYEKGRRRDHILMQQLTEAFNFRLQGQTRLSGRTVYVLHATPRPGYQPPNMESQVLPGMQGTLWIDTQTFQWVKVHARVVSPVSIEGFLARVEPGTYFELEKMPVGDQVWLPKHFSMRARAKVIGIFGHNSQQDDTYFDYKKNPVEYQSKSGG
jgi:hypothetical protein